MKDLDKLFFELIRVAIGTQESLSRLPSPREWGELYKMAKKQSLVGVCFAGLQRLGADADDPSTCSGQEDTFARIRMSEMLYLTWMGITAKIQQKNQTVDEQCVALQKRLSADGLRSCVLKGQGVGQLYAEHLLGLRQSGDIDIYVLGGFEKVVNAATKIAPIGKYTYVHAEWNVYEDTKVELHYRVSTQRNMLANARFQKWAGSFGETTFVTENGITFPSLGFNRIYLLLHCYRHMLGAGIGMRQLMDYYFCLRTQKMTDGERVEAIKLLKSFGLYKFAGAVMFVMKDVFHLDDKYLLCEPDLKEGEYFLKQTLIGGNFGRYDDRVKRSESPILKWKRILFMNLRYAFHYPKDLLWAPIWDLYKVWWKFSHRIK